MRRAQRVVREHVDLHPAVSILARRMRRAQPYATVTACVGRWFQSSPDACAGRNQTICRLTNTPVEFQSSPDACAGRNTIKSGSRPTLTGFNPRPTHAPGATAAAHREAPLDRRFNPRPTHAPGATRSARRTTPSACSFNPRPTHAPGATGPPFALRTDQEVSILARRMRRAQLARAAP